MKHSVKDRTVAFSIHLVLSAVVAIVLFCMFWFVWYPAPFFVAAGGLDIFFIMLGVDVVAGPLLTFAVFNKAKKSLRMDLSIIVLVQAIALFYGLSTLWAGRPVYVVSLGPRFDLIQASEIPPANLKIADATLPVWGPKWVSAKKPTDSKRIDHITESIFAGLDYGHFPELFIDIRANRDEVLKFAEPIASLKKYNPGKEAKIEEWFAQNGLNSATTVFQGLKARSQDMTVILDSRNAEVLGIAPFSPWP
jgi:hypothetical protein